MEYLSPRLYEIIITLLGGTVTYFLGRIHNNVSKLNDAVTDLRITMAGKCVMKEDHKEEHREDHERDMAFIEAMIERKIVEYNTEYKRMRA